MLHQWRGFDPAVKKLSVKKDGGDVDAITASTITSRAYTLAVENALKVFDGLEQDVVVPEEEPLTDEGGQDNE